MQECRSFGLVRCHFGPPYDIRPFDRYRLILCSSLRVVFVLIFAGVSVTERERERERECVGVGVGEKRQSDMGSHFWTTVPSSGLTSRLQNVVL